MRQSGQRMRADAATRTTVQPSTWRDDPDYYTDTGSPIATFQDAAAAAACANDDDDDIFDVAADPDYWLCLICRQRR